MGLRAQSYTSLMAELHQDISRISSFSRCPIKAALMGNFHGGIPPLRYWYTNPNEKSNKHKYVLSSELTYQSLNRALPSRKCSIKAPAKCITSVYVLTEICLQWRKRLGPISKACYLKIWNVVCKKMKIYDMIPTFFMFCLYNL